MKLKLKYRENSYFNNGDIFVFYDFKSRELKIRKGDIRGFYTIETAPKRLKTTTINSKTYLVGTYLFQ